MVKKKTKKRKKKAKNPRKQAKNPKQTVGNGRNKQGKFAKGNVAAVGHKKNTKAIDLQAALLAAVNVEDIKDIAKKLVEQAKTGDVNSAREVFDRTLGKPKLQAEIITTVNFAILARRTVK